MGWDARPSVKLAIALLKPEGAPHVLLLTGLTPDSPHRVLLKILYTLSKCYDGN
jgi:hypothetical protein